MKIVLVGAGGMAMSHVQAYQLLGVKDICAVVDPVLENAKRAAEPFGANIYATVEEMLEKENPDIADICAPSFLHFQYAMTFLERRMHVMCEKPMAHTVKDAETMLETAKKNGVVLMVGQLLRFWPEFVYLKGLIDTGTYGPVRHLEFRRQYGMHPEGWYLNPELCKMVCFEMHIHDADFVNFLFGLPKAIDSIGIEEPDIHMSYVNTRYIYDTEIPMVVQAEGGWSNSTLPFAGGFRATFNRAVLEYADGVLTMYEAGKEPEIIKLTDGSVPHDIVALQKELREFLGAAEGKGEVKTVTPESARDTIRMVSAELESSAKHQPVVF